MWCKLMVSPILQLISRPDSVFLNVVGDNICGLISAVIWCGNVSGRYCKQPVTVATCHLVWRHSRSLTPSGGAAVLSWAMPGCVATDTAFVFVSGQLHGRGGSTM